jgi:hypothetical protein
MSTSNRRTSGNYKLETISPNEPWLRSEPKSADAKNVGKPIIDLYFAFFFLLLAT